MFLADLAERFATAAAGSGTRRARRPLGDFRRAPARQRRARGAAAALAQIIAEPAAKSRAPYEKPVALRRGAGRRMSRRDFAGW